MDDRPIKNIEVGKFYLIHDGSKTGHPGLVVWESKEKNIYFAIRFGTTPNDKNILLNYPISPGIEKSLVYKRPFLGKRRDFGSVAFDDMMVHEEDIELIIKIIKSKSIESKSIRRKDRHFYNNVVRNNKKPSEDGCPFSQGQLSDPKVLHDIFKI